MASPPSLIGRLVKELTDIMFEEVALIKLTEQFIAFSGSYEEYHIYAVDYE